MFTALETLMIVGKKERRLTENICRRTAVLLGRNKKGRKYVYDLVKGLYRLRGEIVHHGLDNVNREESDRLTWLVQNVIIRTLKIRKTKRFTTPLQFKSWSMTRTWP